MPNGFDFSLTETGEIELDKETKDIVLIQDNELKIQMTITRIKSIASNWFYDYVGADMEEIIGRPMTEDLITYGKSKIVSALTMDELWLEEDIFIKSTIKALNIIEYSVYLKIMDDITNEETAKTIIVTLDLVKGIRIRMGW